MSWAMQFKQWISAAQEAGWAVKSVSASDLTLVCNRTGCTCEQLHDLNALGDPPKSCECPHNGRLSEKSYTEYEVLLGELSRRRRLLGLNQDDLGSAMGVADGYVGKMEAMHKFPSIPMLQLWAQTLGVDIILKPIALPPPTIRAMDRRRAEPFRHDQVRTKEKRQIR